MSFQKRVQFLQGKVSPEQLQEALKRYKQQAEFQKVFQSNSEPAPKSSSYNYFGLLGALILGTVASALFVSPVRQVQPAQQQKQRENQDRSNLSQWMQLQTKALEQISNQLADLQFSIEGLKQALIPRLKYEIDIGQIFQAYMNSQETEGEKVNALKLLRLWLGNININPEDKVKSRINTTNPGYKTSFGNNQLAKVMFEAMGFVYKDNYMEFQSYCLPQLQEVLKLVHQELNAANPAPVFSKTEPWKASVQESQ